MMMNLGINPLADFRNPVSVGMVHAGFGGEKREVGFFIDPKNKKKLSPCPIFLADIVKNPLRVVRRGVGMG